MGLSVVLGWGEASTKGFNLANDTGLMMTMLGVDILFLPLPSLVHVVGQFGS